MRLDHIAYRVYNRQMAAQFFIDTMGYQVINEFEPKFSDSSYAPVKCLVLSLSDDIGKMSRTQSVWNIAGKADIHGRDFNAQFYLAPEIFISDGHSDSIVYKWVKEHGPGIHHLAYEVDDVAATMKHWLNMGWAEFLTDEPIKCPGLEQVFTKPSSILGVIIELIKRGKDGFCEDSVAKLMESTYELGRQ